jgi:hypothetical protein
MSHSSATAYNKFIARSPAFLYIYKSYIDAALLITHKLRFNALHLQHSKRFQSYSARKERSVGIRGAWSESVMADFTCVSAALMRQPFLRPNERKGD